MSFRLEPVAVPSADLSPRDVKGRPGVRRGCSVDDRSFSYGVSLMPCILADQPWPTRSTVLVWLAGVTMAGGHFSSPLGYHDNH